MKDPKKKSILLDLSEEKKRKQSNPFVPIVIGVVLISIGLWIAQLVQNNPNELAAQPTEMAAEIKNAPVTTPKPIPEKPKALPEERPEPVEKATVTKPPAPTPQPREHLSEVIKLSKTYSNLSIESANSSRSSDALFFQLENARKANARTEEKQALENEYTSALVEQTIEEITKLIKTKIERSKASDLPAYAALEWKRFSAAYTELNEQESGTSFERLLTYDTAFKLYKAFEDAAIENLKALADRAATAQQTERAVSLYNQLNRTRTSNDEEAVSFLNRYAHSAGEPAHTAPSGIRMRFVPAGRYNIGSPENEFQRDADESLREIQLTRAFYIAETELTQGQWLAIMGRLPNQFPEDLHLRDDRLPVHNVTWAEAKAFCKSLSERSKEYTYRLPTEAEWEVACRAGTKEAYNTGTESLDLAQANVFNINADDNIDAPRATGSYAPNNWGLYDMHGNVWEWTSDWMGDVAELGTIDPQRGSLAESSDENLSTIVLRGGSYYDEADSARSANRWSYSPSIATTYIGFRVVTTFKL